jgi:hypothetical protein
MLMHHAYAVFNRTGRRVNGDFLAFNENFPGSRLKQPVKHIHQGTLTGAVFAKKGVNRLPDYVKTYIVIGLKRPEHHGDVPHIDRIGRIRRRSGIDTKLTHQDSFKPSAPLRRGHPSIPYISLSNHPTEAARKIFLDNKK